MSEVWFSGCFKGSEGDRKLKWWGSPYIFSAHLRGLFIQNRILTQTRNPQVQTASPGVKQSETQRSAMFYTKAKVLKGIYNGVVLFFPEDAFTLA